MSQPFLGTGQVNYIGTPYQQPIQICNGGTAIPLFFDWNAYQASSTNRVVNVKVSLGQGLNVNARLLKQIASCYIDNTNSNVPIFVYCPDTKYCAVAKPNSAGWYPLYTNGQEVWVIGQGFSTGQIPQTVIFITDLFIPPYTDEQIAQSLNLGLASATISRGSTIYNTNVAPFALGDTFTQVDLPVNGSGGIIGPIFPIGPGFIYVTNLQLYAVVSNSNQASNTDSSVQFESASSGRFAKFDIFLPAWQASGGVPIVGLPFFNGVIFSANDLQWKLDATQTWQVRVLAVSGSIAGTATWCFTYTQNPN